MAAPGPVMAVSGPAGVFASDLHMLVCAPLLSAQCGAQVQQAFLQFAMPGAAPVAPLAPAACDWGANTVTAPAVFVGAAPLGAAAAPRAAALVPVATPVAACAQLCGNVWMLSQEQEGCMQVQQALQDAATDTERSALVSELRGHVWEAMQHRFGNHVLQTCIATARPQSVQFVIDEIFGRCRTAVRKVARHQYGCRVLQRLLEHCHAAQVEQLVEELLADAPMLATHIYGNYVVQSLLEHCTPGQLHRLVQVVVQNIAAAGHDSRVCAVLIRALTCASPEDQEVLVDAVLAADGLLAEMARVRHGQGAAKLVLELAGEAALQEAARQLTQASEGLGHVRYGRSVLALLRRRLAQEGALQWSA